MSERKVVEHEDGEGSAYKSMYDGDIYRSTLQDQSVTVHLLRGVCDGTIEGEDDKPCPFQAQHRILRGQGAEDYCGHHGPEKPKERFSGPKEDGHTIIDFEAECVKSVRKETEAAEKVPHQHGPCGDQGFIMIVRDDEDPRVYCRAHARTAWTDLLRVDAD